jgi:predicted permease
MVYPCLIFSSITKLSFGQLAAHWKMPVLALGLAGTGFFLGWLALRFSDPEKIERNSAFLFQSTINNYLFLPLPIVLFLWGGDGVALLVFASLGFEITVWSLGIFLFNRKAGIRSAFQRMFSPPLLTLLFSIILVAIRDTTWWGSAWFPHAPGWVLQLKDVAFFGITSFGSATVALSMLVAGSRIAAMDFKAMGDPQVWLLVILRLAVIPVVYIFLLRHLPLSETAYGILCVIATMPAAIASLVFSERFGGDSDFIAGTLLLTHLASLVTIPLLLSWALGGM